MLWYLVEGSQNDLDFDNACEIAGYVFFFFIVSVGGDVDEKFKIVQL